MPDTTRTLNPLHFEDLEPKRFEDLVRQLAYDFKNWRRLEATGRAGSDDGFDARGYEMQVAKELDSGGNGEEIDDQDDCSSDRLWLVQCKREKSITPAKMKAHLADIRLDASQQLYGIVFAAACDFSKTTRDVLAAWCRDNGISEWHLWGKAELEDQLLQPKNDGLLFAYFGISLTIRRRSKVTEIRRQIAIKKKLTKLAENSYSRLILVRDIDDDKYPDLTDTPNWRVRELQKVIARGLVVRHSMRQAWLSHDDSQWDAAFGAPGQDLDNGQDHWHQNTEAMLELDGKATAAWYAFPDGERAWVYTDILIPYSKIILIDEIGDDEFEGPHVLITGWAERPLARSWIESVQHPTRVLRLVDGSATTGRVVRYPEETRHLDKHLIGY